MVIEHLLLLGSSSLVKIPDHNCSVGGRCGNDLIIHWGPHHIITAEVEVDVFSDPEIVSFNELFLNTKYFEDRSAGDNNLRPIFAEVKGIGGSLKHNMHFSDFYGLVTLQGSSGCILQTAR